MLESLFLLCAYLGVLLAVFVVAAFIADWLINPLLTIRRGNGGDIDLGGGNLNIPRDYDVSDVDDFSEPRATPAHESDDDRIPNFLKKQAD